MNNKKLAKRLLILAKELTSALSFDDYMKKHPKSRYKSESQYNKAMGMQKHQEQVLERFKDKPEALAIVKKYMAKHKALKEQMKKELEALRESKKDK